MTFECEPGTLTEAKLSAIRGIGVTRLSLGVENFSDEILEVNGRAHRSPEIGRAYAFARSLAFPRSNIDLIAGCSARRRELAVVRREDARLEPDSVNHLSDGAPLTRTISGKC